jgi:hypothetical protein
MPVCFRYTQHRDWRFAQRASTLGSDHDDRPVAVCEQAAVGDYWPEIGCGALGGTAQGPPAVELVGAGVVMAGLSPEYSQPASKSARMHQQVAMRTVGYTAAWIKDLMETASSLCGWLALLLRLSWPASGGCLLPLPPGTQQEEAIAGPAGSILARAFALPSDWKYAPVAMIGMMISGMCLYLYNCIYLSPDLISCK